jgi:type IV pilus assembly protein PilV
MKTQKSNQRGFTLIEVLITIIISAIGLLGLAKLQALTLKNNNASQFRSVAIQLGSDAFERMRGNQNGVNGKFYDLPVVTKTDVKYKSAVAACQDAALDCNPDERAKTDVDEMMKQAMRVLPNGAIIICIDSGTGPEPIYDGKNISHGCDGLGTAHAVKVFWLDDRSSRTNTLSSANYASFVVRGTP